MTDMGHIPGPGMLGLGAKTTREEDGRGLGDRRRLEGDRRRLEGDKRRLEGDRARSSPRLFRSLLDYGVRRLSNEERTRGGEEASEASEASGGQVVVTHCPSNIRVTSEAGGDRGSEGGRGRASSKDAVRKSTLSSGEVTVISSLQEAAGGRPSVRSAPAPRHVTVTSIFRSAQ